MNFLTESDGVHVEPNFHLVSMQCIRRSEHTYMLRYVRIVNGHNTNKETLGVAPAPAVSKDFPLFIFGVAPAPAVSKDFQLHEAMTFKLYSCLACQPHILCLHLSHIGSSPVFQCHRTQRKVVDSEGYGGQNRKLTIKLGKVSLK